MKARTIGYWVVTVLVALAFLAGGAGDLSKGPDMLAGMAHLGYPAYLLVLLGAWKVAGGVAILAPGTPQLKEWAYAGMIFDLTGAAYSHGASGDPMKNVITPLVIGVLVIAYLMGIQLTANPLRILGAMAVVVLGAAFFACLSMTLAGLVRNRDRLMGIGQAITMPLFFASNALYPVDIMPSWLRALSAVNPLSYQVNALRALLIGTPGNLWADIGVLVVAAGLFTLWRARVKASGRCWAGKKRACAAVPSLHRPSASSWFSSVVEGARL